MKIWVSSLAKVHDIAAAARPSRVISLLAKVDAFPTLPGYAEDRHHKVAVDDVREEIDGYLAPTGDHVRSLISFLQTWRTDEALLVHCWAGISRSTATAFIAACLHNPEADEAAIAAEIRTASPTAFPNTRIVRFADEMLKRGGRMSAAVEAMGRGEVAEEAQPFSIPARFARRTGAVLRA